MSMSGRSASKGYAVVRIDLEAYDKMSPSRKEIEVRLTVKRQNASHHRMYFKSLDQLLKMAEHASALPEGYFIAELPLPDHSVSISATEALNKAAPETLIKLLQENPSISWEQAQPHQTIGQLGIGEQLKIENNDIQPLGLLNDPALISRLKKQAELEKQKAKNALQAAAQIASAANDAASAKDRKEATSQLKAHAGNVLPPNGDAPAAAPAAPAASAGDKKSAVVGEEVSGLQNDPNLNRQKQEATTDKLNTTARDSKASPPDASASAPIAATFALGSSPASLAVLGHFGRAASAGADRESAALDNKDVDILKLANDIAVQFDPSTYNEKQWVTNDKQEWVQNKKKQPWVKEFLEIQYTIFSGLVLKLFTANGDSKKIEDAFARIGMALAQFNAKRDDFLNMEKVVGSEDGKAVLDRKLAAAKRTFALLQAEFDRVKAPAAPQPARLQNGF